MRLELPFDVEQAEGVNFRQAWPPDAYRANQPKLIVVKHRCFAAVATDLALDERHIGIGIETADMLVKEILSRNLRDRRAVARYGGLTGSPDESGKKRREKGLARTGNARVRKGMIQLAWRFLDFQKESALAKWYRARTENAFSLAQKDDCRPGPQASHRLVALRQ